MELDFFYSFTLGVLAGGGLFGFGLVVGLLINRDTFTSQVKDKDFDPNEEVVDEAFFDGEWSGEGEFPSDKQLGMMEQLDHLHRHSTY